MTHYIDPYDKKNMKDPESTEISDYMWGYVCMFASEMELAKNEKAW